ncbi:MAG: flavodoxin family protein [Candidatus Thorarchaeota archaeon]|jgi:multimeric flavodoxin WrbA
MEVSEYRHVLGIVGSPRKGGNTEILVDEVLAGAVEAGAKTAKATLRNLNISPCKACNGCQTIGKCVQDDDMKHVLKLMEESDVWILGTPIFWWGPTAQFKAFLDRWYGVDQITFQGKRVILAIPMGGGNSHYARHTIGMFEEICRYLGMDHVESIIVPGMNGKGSVRESLNMIQNAREAGIRSVTY